MLDRIDRDAEALSAFEEAIRLRPGFAAAYGNRANLRLDLDDVAGALEDYRRAADLDPAEPFYDYNIANLCSHESDWAGTAEAIDRFLARVPDYPDGWVLRGVASRFLELPDAEAAFQRAYDLDRNNAGALGWLGVIRFEQSRNDEALDLLTRCVSSGPEWPLGWLHLGRVLDAVGDAPGALQAFDRSIELFDGNGFAYERRAGVRMELRDFAGARTDYDRAIDLNPNDARAWHNRGVLRWQHQEDPEGAEADFTQAIDLEPSYARALYHRGTLRDQLGNTAGAAEDYRRLLEVDPNYPRAAEVEGWLQERGFR